MTQNENQEHFDTQLSINGGINLQFDYFIDKKKIENITIFGHERIGLEGMEPRLAKPNDKWLFFYNHYIDDNGTVQTITKPYSSEDVTFVIDRMFELLEKKGYTDNEYFN